MTNPSADSVTDILEEVKRYYKAELGKSDIRKYYKENKFDKFSFGNQSQCGFCNQFFNPFLVDTLQAKSEWSWQTEGPEKQFELKCPHCSEALRLTIYIGQD